MSTMTPRGETGRDRRDLDHSLGDGGCVQPVSAIDPEGKPLLLISEVNSKGRWRVMKFMDLSQ